MRAAKRNWPPRYAPQAVARAAADAVLSEEILEVLRSDRASFPGHAGLARSRCRWASWTFWPDQSEHRLGRDVAGAAAGDRCAASDRRVSRGGHRGLADAGPHPSPHGAKAAQYRAAGMTYGPPGRPFENLDELGYVLGMTKPLLAALKPHLTLWSTSDPDPAAADAVYLARCGFQACRRSQPATRKRA